MAPATLGVGAIIITTITTPSIPTGIRTMATILTIRTPMVRQASITPEREAMAMATTLMALTAAAGQDNDTIKEPVDMDRAKLLGTTTQASTMVAPIIHGTT